MLKFDARESNDYTARTQIFLKFFVEKSPVEEPQFPHISTSKNCRFIGSAINTTKYTKKSAPNKKRLPT